jgi:hypothetical protein
MNWGNWPWSNAGVRNPLSIEVDRGGNIFYRMFSSSGSFTSPTTDRVKLEIILRNPACLKVFKLNADLGSLGKVAEFQGDKFIEINALKKYQDKPNKHQTWKQFFWDYFFYNSLGTAYLWRSNNTNLDFSTTSFYWLNPAKITFDGSLERKLDKLDLSDKSVNELGREFIKYTFNDGTVKDIPLKDVQAFFDLSNSVSGNWYKGNSCIDALYKIIENSEIALSAKNVNLDYTRKFLVSGRQDPENTTQLPLTDDEQKSIQSIVDGDMKIRGVKSQVDIRRFVDDLAKLKLDEAFIADYFMIGTMFGIPRDVLEANLRGATYENQEKATGKHITYSIQPKADDLMEWIGGFIGKELKMLYNHLPFMQYVEKDRAETVRVKAEAFKIFVENGIDPKGALTLTGLEYEGAIKKVAGTDE